MLGRCRGSILRVSTAVEPAIASADMVLIAVNTPPKAAALLVTVQAYHAGIGAGLGSLR